MKRLLILILTCVSLNTFSGVNTVVNGLSGSGIATSGNFTVEETDYSCIVGSSCSNPLTLEKSDMYLKLWFEDKDRVHYSTSWDLTVGYSVDIYDNTGVVATTKTGSLTIDYDPSDNYTDIAIKKFTSQITNKHFLKAVVTITSVSSTVPNDVHLDLEIKTEKYYNLNTTSGATPVVYFDGNGYDATTNELEVYWNYVYGAESYDLEWLFLEEDSLGELTGKNYPIDFRDATRINTNATFYRISMAYPSGRLVFRARPVQTKLDGTRIEGPWSSARFGTLAAPYYEYIQIASAGGSAVSCSSYHFTGLEQGRNWQYAVSYAEQGKRKEVISYFDPSLRNRQQVTVLSSDNTAIVGETKYDYVGRPAINTLPSPQANQGVVFYNNQNKSITSGLYNFEDFDIDTKFDAPNPIDSVNSLGGAYYYSKQNSTPFGVNGNYTPTANGYSYTRTQYKNDGTNRPKKQSGVGKAFKIGSGKETEYLYAKPFQEELDRLFGNEAGNSDLYKKNVVVDPNGQASVTYIDNYGRTIATALSGDTPPNLLDIDTKPDEFDTINVDLSASNYLDNQGRMVVSSTISSTSSTLYTFNYQLDSSYLANTCIGDKSCKYNYYIYITDEYGDKVPFTGGDTLYVDSNISYVNNINFSVTLEVGTYQIHKILELNQESLDEYVQALSDTNACLAIIVDSITTCNPTCEELCREAYVSVNQYGDTTYINDNGDLIAVIDSNGTFISYGTGYDNTKANDTIDAILIKIQNCIDSCNTPIEIEALDTLTPCERKYQLLVADMSPGGQYFDNLPDTDSSAINDFLMQLPLDYNLNQFKMIIQQCFSYSGKYNIGVEWYDSRLGDPWDTREDFWDSVRDNWEPSMGDILVKYHPEYCAFESECCATIENGFCEAPILNNSGYGICDNPAIDTTINNNTNNYLGTGYSIHQFADDSLYNAAYPTMDATTDSLLNLLHNPTTGVIALGIMTSAQFEQSVIDFFTEYAKYDIIKANCSGSLLSGINGITSEGFIIRYPQNPIYETYPSIPALTDSINSSCYQQAIEETDILMANFICKDLLDTVSFRNYIISKKNASCDAYGNPNHKLDSLIAHYLDSLSVPVSCMFGVWQEDSIKTCECDNLIQFIAEVNDTTARAVINGTTSISAAAGVLYTLLDSLDIVNGIDTNDISTWLSSCNSTALSMGISPVPSYLSCTNIDSVEIDTNACVTTLNELAYQNEYSRIRTLVQDSITAYRNRYHSVCFDSITYKETFTMRYVLKEYHYTLYYYDQAGNLIKTISPAGLYQLDSVGNIVHNSILTAVQLDSVKNYRKGLQPTFVRPNHVMVTNYKYNSLNQLTSQYTPDGDSSTFFYDALGRLVASQNAEQLTRNAYSFTRYDLLGRIYRVGELTHTDSLTRTIASDTTAFVLQNSSNDFINWLNTATDSSQIVTTHYDVPFAGITGVLTQTHLRNRIATVTYDTDGDGTYETASHYTYDINGNVNSLVQENQLVSSYGNEYKRIDYDYDLVSGNVNKVSYQAGELDQFYHKYEYDADNRITVAYTSKDGIIWEKESKTFYYPHGPLARMEIGDKQVQALDYAYTIQGWLKAINSSTGESNRDIGEDGVAGNINQNFAQDAYGFSLHYYEGDYSPIGSNANTNVLASINNASFNNQSPDLYNGNISKMIVGLTDEEENKEKVIGNAYQYDQLNRIKDYNAFINSGNDNARTNNSFASVTNSGYFNTHYVYDGNGNIDSLTRNGGFSEIDMDEFSYVYELSSSKKINNRLLQVTDAVDTGNYQTDLDNQPSNNYQYDELGRLVHDTKEEIDTIKWNVSNKITEIIRTSGSGRPNLKFYYDPFGNRIAKKVIPTSGNIITTFYVRDAQGNVMATYKENSTSITDLKLTEHNIYGSSRLGIAHYDDLKVGNSLQLSSSFEKTDTIPFYDSRQVFMLDSADAYTGSYSVFQSNLSEEYGPGFKQKVYPGDKVFTSVMAKSTGTNPANSATLIYSITQANSNNFLYADSLGGGGQWFTAGNFDNNWTKLQASITIPNKLYYSNGSLVNPDSINILTYTVVFAGKDSAWFDDYYLSINDTNKIEERVLGTKSYELTNHLGNVLEVISDRKLSYLDTLVDTTYIPTITDVTGVLVTSTSISRTYAGGSWENAGGASSQSIINDGYVEWEVATPVSAATHIETMMVGLSSTNTDANYNTIDYALYTYTIGRQLHVYESGIHRGQFGTYNIGDILRVERVGNQIKYIKNGSVLYTSSIPSYGDVIMDFTIYNYEGKFINYEINNFNENIIYTADVKSYSDYSPFGMKMPGRYGSESSYRYGFQGQESENEVSNQEGAYSFFKYRMSDNRIGRFFAVDPLKHKFPYYSPYHFSSNSPIMTIELEGLESSYLLNYSERTVQIDIAENNQLIISNEEFSKLNYAFEVRTGHIGTDNINLASINQFSKGDAPTWVNVKTNSGSEYSVRVPVLQVIRWRWIEKEVTRTIDAIPPSPRETDFTSNSNGLNGVAQLHGLTFNSSRVDWAAGNISSQVKLDLKEGVKPDKFVKRTITNITIHTSVDLNNPSLNNVKSKLEDEYNANVNIVFDDNMKDAVGGKVDFGVVTTYSDEYVTKEATAGTPESTIVEKVKVKEYYKANPVQEVK